MFQSLFVSTTASILVRVFALMFVSIPWLIAWRYGFTNSMRTQNAIALLIVALAPIALQVCLGRLALRPRINLLLVSAFTFLLAVSGLCRLHWQSQAILAGLHKPDMLSVVFILVMSIAGDVLQWLLENHKRSQQLDESPAH